MGIVVESIAAQRGLYFAALGYTARTAVIRDPVQTAYVQFFRRGAEPYLELVSSDGPESKLLRASRKGLPLNHLCYATRGIEATIAHLEHHGSLVFQSPVPAVAFDGRLIAGLMGPDGPATELVEDGGRRRTTENGSGIVRGSGRRVARRAAAQPGVALKGACRGCAFAFRPFGRGCRRKSSRGRGRALRPRRARVLRLRRP